MAPAIALRCTRKWVCLCLFMINTSVRQTAGCRLVFWTVRFDVFQGLRRVISLLMPSIVVAEEARLPMSGWQAFVYRRRPFVA